MKEDSIKLYIPEFTVDYGDHDKLWCTFWWMVGQNWGFDVQYQFAMYDYKLITPFTNGVGSKDLAYAFTRRFRKWIQMGTTADGGVGVMKFTNTNWSFVPWECENPRTQRLWVHLYNAVWCGKVLRQDLFYVEKRKNTRMATPLHTDINWWNADHGVRPQDHIPHYLRKPIIGGIQSEPTFAGKIKIEENE